MYTVEPNEMYNNGNVDLRDVTIEVAYRFTEGEYTGMYIGPEGKPISGEYYYDDEGKLQSVYHTAQYFDDEGNLVDAKGINLEKGKSVKWQDVLEYTTANTSAPNKTNRHPFYDPNESTAEVKFQEDDGVEGLNLGKKSLSLRAVKVTLKATEQYTPIYETKHKSDLEGVAGIFVGITGIYFIIDHFLDMHKFNAYARRHHLNLRVATASNEYKLMLQKRI